MTRSYGHDFYYRFAGQVAQGFAFKSEVGGYAQATVEGAPTRAKHSGGDWHDHPCLIHRSVARWDWDGQQELAEIELGSRAVIEANRQDHWWPATRANVVARLYKREIGS